MSLVSLPNRSHRIEKPRRTGLVCTKQTNIEQLFHWSPNDTASTYPNSQERQARVVALRPTYCLSRSKELRTTEETNKERYGTIRTFE